jgi:hypothetical protein
MSGLLCIQVIVIFSKYSFRLSILLIYGDNQEGTPKLGLVIVNNTNAHDYFVEIVVDRSSMRLWPIQEI